MFVIYSLKGSILRLLICPFTELDKNLENDEYPVLCDLEEISSLTHYVVHETGTLHEKADYTLEALPLPCTVTIEGIAYEVTEQPTFEFDVPGTYTIQVDAGPRFLQKEFTIDYQA